MKANCTEGQVCANMSCDMSSIAQTCQYMTLSDNDLVRKEWVADQHINRSHEDMFPLWLGEIFSRGYPNNTTRDELMGIVKTLSVPFQNLPIV